MKIKKNRLKRSYGEFIFKDAISVDETTEKTKIRKLEVYRWKDGNLTLILDSGSSFVIKEKELINGIKKLPKVV